jgi:hypothetical protein
LPSFSPSIQRVSKPQVTTLVNNPTGTRKLQNTRWTHQHKIQANTPDSLPCITRVNIIEPTPIVQSLQHSVAKQNCITKSLEGRHYFTASTKMQQRLTRLAMPHLHNACIISQNTINHLLLDDLHQDLIHYTLLNLCHNTSPPIDLKRYATPMIHPVTGATIGSYCKLMNDPATAEVWMAAFGKDFSMMSQGNNKTGQQGTNAMIVMSHSNIPHIPKDRVITYSFVQ